MELFTFSITSNANRYFFIGVHCTPCLSFHGLQILIIRVEFNKLHTSASNSTNPIQQ
jgi:hypothetical protein